MTGKDLIIYILSHDLLDEPVFNVDGFIGFKSEEEVAEILQVGVATVRALIKIELLEGIQINGKYYIPADFEPPGEVYNEKKI